MHDTPKYGADFTHLDYADPDAPKGGTLRQGAIGTFDSLNPYALRGTAAQGLNLFYDRLMTRVWDEPFTLYPLIARTVEVPEDRSFLRVHLDPRAQFHDGSPILADDVLFSWAVLRDHGRPNMRQVYRLVESAEKEGERSVIFRFGAGYDRETVMILAMMPILSRAWWEGRAFDSSLTDIPVSNGPYRIESVDLGRRISYVRDPSYWAADLPVNRGHFNFDRVVFTYYRDEHVALEAFKAGAFDVRRESDAGRWHTAYDFPAAREGQVFKDSLPHGRPERAWSFIFNMRRPPFDDPALRAAFQYLVDFEWINQTLFHGGYHRITSYYPNSELAARDTPSGRERAILEPFAAELPASVFGSAWEPPPTGTPERMRRNLRTANALLSEAGWHMKDGRRVRDGQALHFEILLDSAAHERLALFFQRSLDQAGITARVRVLDSSAFLSRLRQYDFDMALYHWLSSLSPGTEQYLYWSCEAAEQEGRWNFSGVCSPAIDALSRAISDSSTRMELVARTRALDRALMSQNAMIPLFYAGTDFVARWRTIERPQTTPLYGMVIETWWSDSQ